jgi:hypothetical protein
MEVTMPYVNKENRDRLSDVIKALCIEINHQCTPGDLNYLITNVCQAYVLSKGQNYTHLNDVIGVLMNVILEFNRRVISPYEDQKIKENGDVY